MYNSKKLRFGNNKIVPLIHVFKVPHPLIRRNTQTPSASHIYTRLRLDLLAIQKRCGRNFSILRMEKELNKDYIQ